MNDFPSQEQVTGAVNGSVHVPVDTAGTACEGFDFKDPVEMLYFVDEDIASGRTKLHDWQIQFMLDFADERNIKTHPFQAEVCACNGSGKDMYILAVCAVWLCGRYKMATVAATNGSGTQLDTQTAFHIENLCKKWNTRFGFMVWKINYRYFECLPTESKIDLFATDEANKAEGFHPSKSGGRFAIFASEAKAIPDSIFTALTRCNGYTHRVDVSSPGLPAGYFFNQCAVAIDRKELKDVKDCPPVERIKYHITAYDCPHLTEVDIENTARGLLAQGGRNSPVFKSSILAEFGTTDEMTVISYTHVHRCKAKPAVWIQEQFNKAGLDLSAGGAENVLKIRNGNKIIGTEAFRFEDTEQTLDYLEELFLKWDLKHPESLIWGDCCGIGEPMLRSLKRRGWSNVRFFDSRNGSTRPKVYFNRITEMWFQMSLFLQTSSIILDGDMLTETQLCTRYYKISSKNIHQLLSKLEQKSKGHPSPDRADAHVYSFIGYKSPVKEQSIDSIFTTTPKQSEGQYIPKMKGQFTQQHLTKNNDSIEKRLGKRPDMSHLQSQLDQFNKNNKQIERN